MIERHSIRALVVYNDLNFFFDKGKPQGLTYELLRQFQQYLNKRYGHRTVGINVVFLPTRRDRLLRALVAGRGDIAAGNLAVTSQKPGSIVFADPFLTDVKEIAVGGPRGPKLSNLASLSGKKVYVRIDSNSYHSLIKLNALFESQGRPKVKVIPVSASLQDGDVLDMVNAGLLPMTFIAEPAANVWGHVFGQLTLYPGIAVKSGVATAWAVRKDSQRLLAAINAFMRSHKAGTRMGNILINKYLKNGDYVRDSLEANSLVKFDKTFRLFQKYARRYHLDWIYVAALAFQESRLDSHRRGSHGGIGIMQVKPHIASIPAVHIGYISRLENNIHAGTKYLRYLIDTYFADKKINRLNKMLFACAAYNAGPTRIAALRKKAAELGLDPDRWFGNVEVVAARDLGRTTVQYVRNIYKYAVAYSLYLKQKEKREHEIRSLKKRHSSG